MNLYIPPLKWLLLIIAVIFILTTIIYVYRRKIHEQQKSWELNSVEFNLLQFLKLVFKKKNEGIAVGKITTQSEQPAKGTKDNLPEPLFDTLIGRDDYIQNIQNLLRDPNARKIIGIYGYGGVGKSSLVRQIAENIKKEDLFSGIWWLTAKRKSLDPNELTEKEGIISYETIIDKLISWIGISHEIQKNEKLSAKENKLKEMLQRYSLLIILDNLETSKDQNLIAKNLMNLLANTRSKAIMTSREKWVITPFQVASDIEVIDLGGLSETYSIQLMRSTGKKKVPRMVTASDDDLQKIARAVGYIPLALILCVGLMDNTDIQTIIEKLKHIQSQNVIEMYEYLFRDSWNSLTASAKQLLITIYQFDLARGIGAYKLRNRFIKDLNDYDDSIDLLDRKGLIEIQGTVEKTRYLLHPLTANFIRAQIK